MLPNIENVNVINRIGKSPIVMPNRLVMTTVDFNELHLRAPESNVIARIEWVYQMGQCFPFITLADGSTLLLSPSAVEAVRHWQVGRLVDIYARKWAGFWADDAPIVTYAIGSDDELDMRDVPPALDNAMVRALPPEHQEARERQAIMDDRRTKELVDGQEFAIIKISGSYCVATEDGRWMRVDVVYLPNESGFCGPARFELVFHDPVVLTPRS
ncbi:MAG: hypothetical protein RL235_1031 [Chlamydiota bacterium]|jgi:hypothetical protein